MSFLAKLKSIFSRKGAPSQGELVSVVMLLRELMPLNEADLANSVIKSWGRDLRKEANEYVVLQSGSLGKQVGFINFDRMMILVTHCVGSYVRSEDLHRILEQSKEMRTQKVFREQAAWLSFDLMEPKNPTDKDKQHFYLQACALVANLLQESCLGVITPETNELRPYDNQLKTALLSKVPLAALREWERVPIVDDQDLRMEAAMAEAKRRWPEFEAAFRDRKPSQKFIIKAPFRDGDNGDAEWMWVLMASLYNGFVEGELLSEPVNVRSVKTGESVRIPTSTVADWAYNEGEKMRGGFTDAVLRNTRG